MQNDKTGRNLLNRFLYHIIRLLFRFLGGLPAKVREACASLLGSLLYTLDRHHRHIAIRNLGIAFGREKSARQIRGIARQVFENMARIFFEIGWTMRMEENEFSRYFSLSGVLNYRQAVKRGKGVLILLSHFGNWELLPIVAYMAKMPAAIVYRPIDLPALDRVFRENRSRFGGLLIPNRAGAMQKICRAIRKGYAVGLLMDQNEGKRRGIFVEYFNHRACTNPGMARLALKTDAAVIPLFLIRQQGRFAAEFGPVLTTIRTGDPQKDVDQNTQMYNDVIESYVRRHPDQWFWVHNRWKTRPLSVWPDPARKDRWRKNQQKLNLS